MNSEAGYDNAVGDSKHIFTLNNKVFNPALRDESYARGLDKIFRRIEFACSLAYGTISDPQNVDKTAEEVKYSKQRSFAAVSDMQTSLQTVLENYIYAINAYASACKLAPEGTYETQFNWGDGVLEDREKETQIRMQEVNSNIVDKVEYLKWRYSATESKVAEMMPKNTGIVDFFPTRRAADAHSRTTCALCG